MLKNLPVLLLLLLIPACGRNEGHSDKNREADLIFAVGDEHNHLDPQKISWVADGRIANCLYEPLVKFDAQTLEIVPGVAASWTLSDDQKTYTFHLRDDARWSDGKPVTAGDFVYAWRRALLPDMAADYAMLLFTIRGGEAFFNWRTAQLEAYVKHPAKSGTPAQMWAEAERQFHNMVAVRAPDDRTITVTLENPTPYFIELCAFVTFMPNPAHVLSADPQFSADTGMLMIDPKYWSDPARLVSNGPYILKRREFKRDLLMVANDHYHGRASMANTSILEKIVPDPQSTVIAYESGEVDFLPDLGVNASVTADLAAQNRPDVHLVPMAGVYFYNFNCLPKKPDGSPNPLTDANVRRALSMGFDRQVLVSQVTRMNQPVIKTFVPDVLPGYDPPAEAGCDFDVDAAKKLLADAGYPDGKGLTGLSILYNTGFGHERIAQAIKRMWEQNLGVIVTLEGVEVKSFAERLKKQDYTICRASWFGDYRDPTTWLDKCLTNNGNNDCRYSNPKFDELMARAATQTDATQRLATLREAEALMLRDSPMAMIYQYISVYLFDPTRVQNLPNNAWNIYELDKVKVVR